MIRGIGQSLWFQRQPAANPGMGPRKELAAVELQARTAGADLECDVSLWRTQFAVAIRVGVEHPAVIVAAAE